MKSFVITINRGYGSGGRYIGKQLAKRLGIAFYDRELISLVSDSAPDYDECVSFKISENTGAEEPEFVSEDSVFNSQSSVIRDIAAGEACVIVGRCADYVLRDFDGLISIFVHAPLKSCMKRVMSLYELNPDDAKNIIINKDKSRSLYYEHYTGRSWTCADNYDLCINSGILGTDKSIDMLEHYVRTVLDGR